MDLKELKKREDEIIERAKQIGVKDEYLFRTTLDRYQTQIRFCEDLKKAYEDNGTMVEKEYIKGRLNLVVNPVINAYNQTVAGANKTADTMIKILKSVDPETKKAKNDPVLGILKG
jgi:Tat protein secretion system quality control protein TatD with DNase activity